MIVGLQHPFVSIFFLVLVVLIHLNIDPEVTNNINNNKNQTKIEVSRTLLHDGN